MATPASELLPDRLVGIIREVGRRHLLLQRTRYTSSTAASVPPSTVFTSLVMKTKTISPQAVESAHHGRMLASTWSEAFRISVEPLGDEMTNELWGLVSTVICILESGDADRVNASAAVAEWNSRFATDVQEVQEFEKELRAQDPVVMDDEEIGLMLSDALEGIERLFLYGSFKCAASMVDAVLCFIRRGGTRMLTAEVEGALADVVRLLDVGYSSPETHTAWQAEANELVYEAKRILQIPDVEGATVIDSMVEDLCATCLDILLIISGDAELLCRRCRSAGRSAIDFLVSVCTISKPHATLMELGSIFAVYVPQWGDEKKLQLFYEVVKSLLTAESLVDVVSAMSVAGREAARWFTWEPDRMFVEDVAHNSDDSLRVDESRPLNPRNTSARVFALACMAAHVADLCAPAVVAPTSDSMRYSFARIHLVTSYISLFSQSSQTWRIAVTYAAYSPLMNPAVLYNITTTAARFSLDDSTVYTSLCTFFHRMWDSKSPHQQALRAQLDNILPENATVLKWCDAVDYYYREAYRDAHRFLITAHLNRNNAAYAVWLAVETQLTSMIELEIKGILKSKDALVSDVVYKVGSAVQNSFIALDTCPTATLARFLQACAALSSYRRAATVVTASMKLLQQSVSSKQQTPAVVETLVWCLETIETALHAMDSCSIMLHPTTTFTIVEHGVDMLIQLRSLLRDCSVDGESVSTRSTYEHIRSVMVPLLLESYEVSYIHFSKQHAELENRVGYLAEKLASVRSS